MTKHQWLWGYVRATFLWLILGVLMLIFEKVAIIIGNLTQKYIIDDVIILGNYHLIQNVIMIYVISQFFWLVMKIGNDYFLTKTEIKIGSLMDYNLLGNLQRKEISLLQKKKTGEMLHYFTNDIFSLCRFVAHEIPRGIQQIFSVLILSFVIIWEAPEIFVLITVLSFPYILIINRMAPKVKKVAREIQRRKSNITVKIDEGVSSAREVAAFNRHKWFELSYFSIFNTFFDEVMREGKLVNKQLFFSSLIHWGVLIAVLGIGGLMVLRGELNVGSYILIYHFSGQLLEAYNEVFQFFMTMTGKMVYAERVKNVMEEEEILDSKQPLVGQIKTIRFDNVSFSYSVNHQFVLSDMSIEITNAQKIAIVGPSGSGKSTMVRLILGHFIPRNGEVLINGLNQTKIKKQDYVSKINVVFQDPYILPDTIRNNIILGRCDIDEQRLVESCKVANIYEWIDLLPQKFDTVIGERGVTLSGGQRQRIAIARAIVGHPEILILDEATSALDEATEDKIFTALNIFRKGLTTLIVTHRLSTVKDADYIYVFDNGSLVEKGKYGDLTSKNGLFRELLDIELDTKKEFNMKTNQITTTHKFLETYE
ncbi:ABC transporter ATP-binding protein [Paenibacillus solani]|uniref:ABC transporter ATP-binding protein n=1 Tax=Paenibacillus solani TaxID=1705565 RepID=UPI003D26E5D3